MTYQRSIHPCSKLQSFLECYYKKPIKITPNARKNPVLFIFMPLLCIISIDRTYFTVFNQNMTKTQALTIPNIVSAMKKAGFATKDDLKNFATKDDLKILRKQIDDDQFEARSEFYAKMIKPDLKGLDEKIDKVDCRLGQKIDDVNNKLSLQISGIKDDLEGLNTEFSTSPSREEFNKLSRSVLPQ